MNMAKFDFERVYEEFHDRIRLYLDRLVGAAESEDLAQEVFVKVNRNMANFEGKSSLSTWIYRIATNSARDRFRSKAHREDRQTTSLSDTDDARDAGTPGEQALADKQSLSADREAVRSEMTECIREFVRRLPPDYRDVIVLGELKDLKNQEIADILGISLGAVKIRLHRARSRLKSIFEAGCEFYRDEDNRFACDRKQPE